MLNEAVPTLTPCIVSAGCPRLAKAEFSAPCSEALPLYPVFMTSTPSNSTIYLSGSPNESKDKLTVPVPAPKNTLLISGYAVPPPCIVSQFIVGPKGCPLQHAS